MRREWQEFVRNASLQQVPSSHGRGVVVIGGRCHNVSDGGGAVRGCSDYTLDALFALASLRRVGCHLPVELWHDHDSRLLGAEGAAAAAALSFAAGEVRLCDIHTLPLGKSLKGYQVISYVLLHSSFREVLFLGADNILVDDPTPLFASAAFQSSGAIFWPGAWNYNLLSLLWEVIGQAPRNVPSLDTSQLLLDRTKHHLPLELAVFWNLRGPNRFYRLSNGDTDLFLFAWMALSAPYFLVSGPVNFAGYVADDGAFCAHTWLHSHPEDPEEVLFAHRTLYRFSATVQDEELRWTALKKGRAPRGLALSFFFSRNVRVGDSCLSVRHSRCLCTKDGQAYFPCPDADSVVDASAWANATLRKLASLEQGLIRLRGQLTGGSFELRPRWWESFARYLAHSQLMSGT